MSGGRLAIWTTVAAIAAVVIGLGLPAVSAARPAGAATATVGAGSTACAEPDVSSRRDPTNPLALPTRPASGDPLQGAHFFIDGPRHGQAAGAVAKLLGLSSASFTDGDSWAQFKADHLAAINHNAKARLLAKIADQEETQSISLFAEGGGPGAIYAQTNKVLCDNLSADPTQATVPVMSTFFIYPNGHFCPTLDQIQRWEPTFKRDVNEMARAIGHKRAVILEEIDSIGTSGCLQGPALKLWLSELAYEANRYAQLPHAVAYAEAGTSDAQDPLVTAKRLWQAGIRQLRGFWTNGTHFAWSIDEIRWAENISDELYALSHHRYRAYFVVNTAQNGQGPKLNPHPFTQGFENTCNPPGRGLGRLPTGNVNPTFDARAFPFLDGFLWSGTPGRSNNSDCPGGPWRPAGVFDTRFALELAQNANQKLGPGYPSLPY